MDVHAKALVTALAAVYAAGHALARDEVRFTALATSPGGEFTANPALWSATLMDFQAVGTHTSIQHGVVGGTAVLMQQLHQFNAAKAAFREALRAYKEAHSLQRTERVHEVLHEAGFAPMHLNAVMREVQVLPFVPRWVHYSRVRHNARQKITKAQARARLEALSPSPAVTTQLDRLRFADETLVIHRDLNLWVVNAVGFAAGAHPAPRVRRFTSLPLAYLHENSCLNPDVAYSEPRKARKPRADKRTEDDVLLASLHAYQYKTQRKTPQGE